LGEIYTALETNSRRYPDKLAIKSLENSNFSYKELYEKVNTFASFLQIKGISYKQQVGIILDDFVNEIFVIFALNKLGCCIVPLDKSLTESQIKGLLSASKCNTVLTDCNDRLLNVSELIVINCFDIKNHQKQIEVNNFHYDTKQPFLITLSSGSTGNPKPIVFSELNKINRFKQVTETYALEKNDVILCASPFHHSLGQRLTFLPLLLGGTLVKLDKFSPTRWIDSINSFGVTFTIPVSSHLMELLPLFKDMQNDHLKSLKILVSSSASISVDAKKNLFSNYSFKFHEMYGCSETATATDLSCENIDKISSVGKPLNEVEIKILVNGAFTHEHDKVGEICIKSKNSFIGYYNNDSLTYDSFKEKFFKTGDLGYIDADGFLYFLNRKKDVIISGGKNIYPSDIDSVLTAYSDDIFLCAIGAEDEFLGEVVVVAIEISSIDNSVIERNLRFLANNNLAPFQRPLKYIFIKKFPRLSSGKIDKLSLTKEINSLNLQLGKKLASLRSK